MVRQIRKARRSGDFQGGVRLGTAGFLFLLAITIGAAQEPAPVQPSPVQQAAEKQTAAWQTLASSLEMRIARMLPCDPRVRSAIEEVSRASEARLGATAQYLQAAAAQAGRDSEAASAALAAEQGSAREGEVETAEAEQERIAIEGQLAELRESVKSKPGLEEARAKLESIADMVRQRSADAQGQAAARTALIAALGDVVTAFQARQKAIESESGALTIETARWSDYYAARLARAQTECSITTRPVQRKKQ